MNVTRRQALTWAASVIAAGAVTAAMAQTYPSRPITLVVSYPAGGDTDVVARLFAEKLSARAGQPVVVENRAGASGTIGNAYVSKAAPDGYTLLLTPGTFTSAPLVLKVGAGASYDVLNGFTPIIQTGTVPLFLVAGAQTGFTSLKDVVSAAKAGKPLSYGSPGSGSPMHFIGEMLNKAAGVNIVHAPYRGVAPAVTDLLGGHLPLAWVPLGPVAQYIASGKMVPLAVAQSHRSSLLPKVPTLEELGYKDMDPMSWQGLLGPKGMSPELVKTLNGHFNDILKMPDVVARMASFGTVAVGGDPARLAKANADSYVRYIRLVREFGIQAD